MDAMNPSTSIDTRLANSADVTSSMSTGSASPIRTTDVMTNATLEREHSFLGMFIIICFFCRILIQFFFTEDEAVPGNANETGEGSRVFERSPRNSVTLGAHEAGLTSSMHGSSLSHFKT